VAFIESVTENHKSFDLKNTNIYGPLFRCLMSCTIYSNYCLVYLSCIPSTLRQCSLTTIKSIPPGLDVLN